MSRRGILLSVLAFVSSLAGSVTFSQAELFRLDGSPIPGTEELSLRPNAQLDDLDLTGLAAQRANLTNASFRSSNLTASSFVNANLDGADFTDAVVSNARLGGITREQFYSTASYQQRSLGAVILSPENGNWDLGQQDLRSAILSGNFAGSNLRDANLDGAYIGGDFRGVDFSDAVVTNSDVYLNSMSADQIYSTLSYRSGDMRGIRFRPGLFFTPYDLRGWDFRNQNLQDAILIFTDSTGTDYSGANLANGQLGTSIFVDATFRQANLNDADLFQANLTNAIMSETQLVGVDFRGATLDNASLAASNVRNANLTLTRGFDSSSVGDMTTYNQWTSFPEGFDPATAGLIFVEAPEGDFDADSNLNAGDLDRLITRVQQGNNHAFPYRIEGLRILGNGVIREYENSYRRDVSFAGLQRAYGINRWLDPMFDLTGDGIVDNDDSSRWLTLAGEAVIGRAYTRGDANLDGVVDEADLEILGTNWQASVTWSVGNFDDEVPDVLISWTDGDFDGDGLVGATDLEYLLEQAAQGDFNVDGVLDAGDVDQLSRWIGGFGELRPWEEFALDLNDDQSIDQNDLDAWVKRIKRTWFGDGNLDGVFDSEDLVRAFAAGEYEDDVAFNSSWSEGDWNADGEFDSSDLIVAFRDGGYSQGPRAAVVPEPDSLCFVMILLIGISCRHRARRM